MSPTTEVKDEREGLPCPSASLFQSMDPRYDEFQLFNFISPAFRFRTGRTKMWCLQNSAMIVWFYLPVPSSWLTRCCQELFAACRSSFSATHKHIQYMTIRPSQSSHKLLQCLTDTLGLKARVFGLHGSTTEGYGSNMMLLREDWRAALHMATSKSTTCRTHFFLI